MAIVTLNPKITRIIVWVLDSIILLGYGGQSVFGYVIPEIGSYLSLAALLLSVVFGIFWDPNKNKPVA